MKFKALFLSLLILAPLLLVLAPSASATTGPIIWVNPKKTDFEAPSQVSKTFIKEVKLWNKEDLTGVGIYAFDFNVSWYNSTFGQPNAGGFFTDYKTSMISLVGVSFISPWDHYFVVANESIHYFNATDSQWYDGWHLAITALDTSPPLTEVQIVLLTLTFHIDNEPVYPDIWMTPFYISIVLSDNEGSPIPAFEVDSGEYTIHAGPPDVDLLPDTPLDETGTPYIVWYKVGTRERIEVWMSNMSRVYGFGFQIQYNTTDKKVDIQSVVIDDNWPPPYEFFYAKVTKVGDQGFLTVNVTRPSEKPAPSCKINTMVASFDLITRYDSWDTLYLIPMKENTTVTLTTAYQLTKLKNGTTVTYGYNYPSNYALAPSTTIIKNEFKPFSTKNEHGEVVGVDLNLDGEVGLQDLQALALLYGESWPWPSWGGLDWSIGAGIVDIFDFVIVATKYGKPYSDP